MKTKRQRHRRVGLLTLVRSAQSGNRRLVGHPRRIPALSLKGDAEMKTTNLKQINVVNNEKSFNSNGVGTTRCWS